MTTLLSEPTNSSVTTSASASELIASVITDPVALRQVRQRGLLGLGESYMDGRWDVQDLDAFMYEMFTRPAERLSARSWAQMLFTASAQRLIDQQAGKRAFKIGSEHYDLGNDLFEVMLDRSMTYTCGYWANANDLDAAQEAKLDILCRKLELQPGMRVLDIGCGWGNFAFHAASRYGVHVTGITVSAEQAKVAQNRCAELDVDIRIQDYREISETFDSIVSIEMIEAVGRSNMGKYYQVVDRCLADGGLFGLQAISGNTLTRTSDRRLDQYVLWLLKYIFPDGYLPQTSELTGLRGTSLRVEDWQSFSDDYIRTLHAWAGRFDAGWDQLSEKYGERFRRRWHYYLYGCAAAFRAGLANLYQIVYSKGRHATRYEPVR